MTEKMITLYEKIIKNEKIDNNLSLVEINNEFKERSRNVFDRSITYTLNYLHTTILAGLMEFNIKALKEFNFTKNSLEIIIKMIKSKLGFRIKT
jgi:hypothetical protein